MSKRPRIDCDKLLDLYRQPQTEYVDVDDGYDASVLPFTDLCTGDQYNHVMANLEELLATEQERLQVLLPYGVPFENWPWIEVKYNKREHDQMIWDVLTILMGVFLNYGVGFIKDGEYQPVHVFLPFDNHGRYDVDRANRNPFYAHSDNPSVYVEMRHLTIETLIAAFVHTLDKLKYFTLITSEEHTGQSTSAFAPPSLFPVSIKNIRMNLMGDTCTAPKVSGCLPHDTKTGVQYIKPTPRRQWGINGNILVIPDPMKADEWERVVYIREQFHGESDEDYKAYTDETERTRFDAINQVYMVSGQSGAPSIPTARHFSGVDAASFDKLFRIVNGAIYRFVHFKDSERTNEYIMQWVSDLCVTLLHEYCPNMMSYIGVQYLQRICCMEQEDHYRSQSPEKPRAYFTSTMTDDRSKRLYESHITATEARLVASFIDTFGCLFFSIESYVAAFVGEGGSGKNFIRRLAVRIAGGIKHTMRIDRSHGTFSMSMLKRDTFLLTMEDASDDQVEIPASLRDSCLGAKRGQRGESLNINAKNKDERQVEVTAISLMYMRNEPTEEARSLRDVPPQIRIIASVAGTGGGKERRVKVAPPLMEKANKGTANPVDSNRNLAFSEAIVMEAEAPYIILISWLVTTISELVGDEQYGLCGESGNVDLEEKNQRYLAMGTVNVHKNLSELLEERPVDVYKFKDASGREKSLTYAQSVPLGVVKQAYKQRFRIPLKSVPPTFKFMSQTYRCTDCHMIIDGSHSKAHAVSVPNAYNACNSESKDKMVAPCPKSDDRTPCYKKMKHCVSVFYGYTLKNDS